ncbi:MAG: 50S ribosomal protein L29 [Verrucomicrobia bacterium]|nr:MAG: 50S ribosomal protein L29 [Verrucomicrobiota bacterium]
MKTSEWKSLTEDELLQRRQDARKEMFNLRLQRTSGQLEKPSRIRELRRDIARANTYLRQQPTKAKGN